MRHKIVNGLHCITNKNGRISVYTQEEYDKLMIKPFFVRWGLTALTKYKQTLWN